MAQGGSFVRTMTDAAAAIKTAHIARIVRFQVVASMMAPAGACTITVAIEPAASAMPMPPGFQ